MGTRPLNEQIFNPLGLDLNEGQFFASTQIPSAVVEDLH